MAAYVCIGVYAGDWVKDGRRDKRKPAAFVYGIGSRAMCDGLAASKQAAAGGQAANVVYESLNVDVAENRYSLRV